MGENHLSRFPQLQLAHTTAYNSHQQTPTHTSKHQLTPANKRQFIRNSSPSTLPTVNPPTVMSQHAFSSLQTHTSFPTRVCVGNVFSASSSGKNVLLERADYSPLTFRVLFVIFVYFFFLFSLPHTRARACMTVQKYLIKKRSAINTKK